MFDPLKHITKVDLLIGAIYREMRRRRLASDVQPNDNGNEVKGFQYAK